MMKRGQLVRMGQGQMVRRLRAEHGMALPLALGIMLVLSIAVFAVIEFSSANTRNSSLNERRQSAKALAEAGVSHGASVLAKQLSLDGGYTSSPTGTATLQGTSVPWTATYQTGSSPRTWIVSSTASLANPTGPGASTVPRTVSARFSWTSSPDPSVWRGLTLFNQGDVPLMSDDGAAIKTPVYIKGNVKITAGKYLGNSFQVDQGNLTLEGDEDVTSIGASARPSPHCGPSFPPPGGCANVNWKIDFPPYSQPAPHLVSDFRVEGTCTVVGGGTCSQTSSIGGPAGKIWLTSSAAFSTTVDPVIKPTVDFTTAKATAHLRWNQGCQTQTGSPPSFSSTGDIQLMTGSSYTCRRDTNGDGTVDGELSWTTGNPGTLTVKGNIYFNGNIKQDSDNRWGKVSGKAIIYTDGFVLLKGVNSGLCGVTGGTVPACNNATGVWEPATTPDFLTIITKSTSNTAIDQTDFRYQGGFMAPNGGYLSQGSATFKGAITVDKAEIKNEGIIDAWSPFTAGTEIPGLPGSISKLSLVQGSWDG
jgi:hypothetical protein